MSWPVPGPASLSQGLGLSVGKVVDGDLVVKESLALSQHVNRDRGTVDASP